jgi:hypothetical protein
MADREVIAATLAAALLRRQTGPVATAGTAPSENVAAARQAVVLYETILGMVAARPTLPT